MGAELFHADGQTDMKLIVAVRNFANAPKNRRNLSKTCFSATLSTTNITWAEEDVEIRQGLLYCRRKNFFGVEE